MESPASQRTLSDRLQGVQANLRHDLEVSRHLFRGEPGYVVRNPTTFQSHRFSAADYQILVSLDSEKSLGEVFEELVAAGALQEEQREDFFGFIVNLHQFGFLNLPISDSKSLYTRFRQRRVSQRRAQIIGFLFWRVPLFNPDAFLDRTVRYVRPIFSRIAFVLWLALMIGVSLILWKRWAAFVAPLHHILATNSLAYLWLSLIGLKVLHEFGHAYACKTFGGKVPEMGAYFICFTPCAYVDASCAWGFPSKRQRIIVSLAGMYVESIVAAFALILWNATGPSFLNSLAHQMVLLASVVTVGFNINPLMRYDGYYIFSDLVEIPNLRQRSTSYVHSFAKHWLLGVRTGRVRFSRGMKLLLLVYGVGASLWKVSLVLAICVAIALKIHLLGALMAAFYAATVVYGTVRHLVAYLCKSPETAPVRRRAITVGIALPTAVVIGIACVPVYVPVDVNGVVAAEHEETVRARASGFLRESEIVPSQSVGANDVLCVLNNVQVQAGAQTAQAQVDLLRLQAASEIEAAPAFSAMTRHRIAQAERTAVEREIDVDDLLVRAPASGKIVECGALRHAGSFIKEGDRIATIASGRWLVESLITAEELADIKPRVGQRVAVRLIDDASDVRKGRIVQISPSGSRRISKPELTQLAGGDIAVAPDTMKAYEPFFEISIELDKDDHDAMRYGMTALVRFEAQSQTIGTRLYRSALRFINKLRT